MALSQRLDLRQSQSLVMTPQLQQAIKLLQLSNVELAEFVEQELEQNPLLERGDPETDFSAADEPTDTSHSEPLPDPYRTDSAALLANDGLPAAGDSVLDTSYENVWPDGPDESLGSWSGSGGRTDFSDIDSDFEQGLSETLSLRDHLTQQINLDLPDPADRLIALMLMDHLDEAGYLSVDIPSLADALQCEQARVEAILARLQRLDPAGVFARSLSECLAIQLRERNRCDPAMQALLDNLDLLAARNFSALQRLCGVDTADLQDMVAEIRALNPKPASTFDRDVAATVVPDILMRAQQGGGWIVELNPDTLPSVLVNQRYVTRIASAARNREEKDYISERLQYANWLVKSLHQRATTILRVATEIVRQQEGFFNYGIAYLKPLILRDIADAIGMHESTISRVTTNKFMSTPRGLFELKYFFTAAIAGADGMASHSAEAVRHRIKSLIDAESPRDILSDDKIVEILREQGVDVARRTVAKYRESMKISSSVQRRREKAMFA